MNELSFQPEYNLMLATLSLEFKFYLANNYKQTV